MLDVPYVATLRSATVAVPSAAALKSYAVGDAMPVLPIVSVAPPALLMGERMDEAVAVTVGAAAPAVPFSLSNAENNVGVPEGGRLYCCCCGVAATAQSLSYVKDASSLLALSLPPTIS